MECFTMRTNCKLKKIIIVKILIIENLFVLLYYHLPNRCLNKHPRKKKYIQWLDLMDNHHLLLIKPHLVVLL